MNGPLRRLSGVIALLFGTLLISTTWIQFVTADSLATHERNTRTLYQEFGRPRGPILVAADPVARSVPVDDSFGLQREYPGGELYSHVTGYFSLIGVTGMEAAAGDLLSGTSDQLFYRRISDLLTGEQPQGASVELTIDPAAQRAAWDALGNRRGAVVALDPRTGDVLALVSKPGFDPDLLAGHTVETAQNNQTRLLNDGDRPLDNRAIASRGYPPGSVFKLVTAAAALSSGRFSPDTQLTGVAQLDLPQTDLVLGNSGGGACSASGRISFTDALRVSCNTAFGQLGLDLGDDALREQAQKFGFGQELRIPLTVTPSTFPAAPSPPETAYSAIGQFDVRVTPLQMAMVAAGIANGGTVMKPNLVRTVRSRDLDIIDQSEPEKLSDATTPQVAEQLTGMMVRVVEAGTGTRAQISGVEVAGKTGTAQQGEDAQGRERPPHAWFTAFAPADDPQIALAVVVEDGGGLGDVASGGRLAAPVAREVMEAVIDS